MRGRDAFIVFHYNVNLLSKRLSDIVIQETKQYCLCRTPVSNSRRPLLNAVSAFILQVDTPKAVKVKNQTKLKENDQGTSTLVWPASFPLGLIISDTLGPRNARISSVPSLSKLKTIVKFSIIQCLPFIILNIISRYLDKINS